MEVGKNDFDTAKKHDTDRRIFLRTMSLGSLLALLGNAAPAMDIPTLQENNAVGWKAGVGRRVITPQNGVWLAGFGTKRVPGGKLHDIWVKVLALQDKSGRKAVLVSSDHQGMSRTIYERLYQKMNAKFGLDRSEFMLTFSHNHSGPCLTDDLVDYYPSDEDQKEQVRAYTDWMELQVIGAVEAALKAIKPVEIQFGGGQCTFAVNRRENKEADVPHLIAEGKLKGAVDHSVPVLSVQDKKSKSMLAVLFGYACHPTTLAGNEWSGDYPGFAQARLEATYPGTSAMFFNTCGGDQNPLPRRTVELCEKYGEMLADAVKAVLSRPMKSVQQGFKSDFSFVNIDYEEVVTREKLIPIAEGNNPIHVRWAKRMLAKLENGEVMPTFYPYPVQAWQLGKELLLIGIGGEAVVDYSLRFKKEFGEDTTWVSGYTNDMAAYIPSRRVWEEGGYEGGSHLDEYGRPAWRWAGDIEDRIAGEVHKIVGNLRRE